MSGPGAVNGAAGLSHAAANCWPLLQLSGSCESSERGKGAFQECDQVEALRPYCKCVVRPSSFAWGCEGGPNFLRAGGGKYVRPSSFGVGL